MKRNARTINPKVMVAEVRGVRGSHDGRRKEET
jgi:hypothetical protein